MGRVNDPTQGENELIPRAEDTAPVAGDSNGDGIFNSSDLVFVFQAGKYEDGIPNNATFADGDWNGDGDFDSSDLTFAFQKSNYIAAAIDGHSLFASDHDRHRRDLAGNHQVNFEQVDLAISELESELAI